MTTFIKNFIAIGLALMTYPMTILAQDITLDYRENWAVMPAVAIGIDQIKIDRFFDLSFQKIQILAHAVVAQHLGIPLSE